MHQFTAGSTPNDVQEHGTYGGRRQSRQAWGIAGGFAVWTVPAYIRPRLFHYERLAASRRLQQSLIPHQ
jgi:hypothetical protein